MTLGPLVRVVIDEANFRALVTSKTISVTASARYGLIPVEIALNFDPHGVMRAVTAERNKMPQPQRELAT